MLGTIISLFTLFLYTALGTYVLTKNPHERTNKIFAILMLVFIIWSVGTYNIGIVANNVPLKEAILYIKIQLSGAILALTVLVFFALSFTRAEKILKNPLTYLIIVPSIYILYLIWFSNVSSLELNAFSTIPEAKKEFFLFSTIFAVVGIYLLLKYYTASKYREHEQAKLILTGTIAAILAAITANIILPMFFEIYVLQLSTIAPAVMGIFFAYAVYQYGLFIKPMPELSVTSFCGTDCTLCPEFLDESCRGCKLDKERYKNCEAYRCAVVEKGYSGCIDCPEIITCIKRKANQICFGSKPLCSLKSGCTSLVEGEGYELFLEGVKQGVFGIIATTSNPELIRKKYDLTTTPIVWISDEAFDMGVKPNKLGRLSIMLINFMKRASNAVVLLDGVNELIKVNGFDNVLNFIQILSSTVKSTKCSLIISNLEGENFGRLKHIIEI